MSKTVRMESMADVVSTSVHRHYGTWTTVDIGLRMDGVFLPSLKGDLSLEGVPEPLLSALLHRLGKTVKKVRVIVEVES